MERGERRYGGATIGVTDIAKDKKQDQAFYGDANATTDKILQGREMSPRTKSLTSALPI